MKTITSAKTSGNRLAGGFKKITWFTGTVNLDLGGGKYDKGTEYLTHLIRFPGLGIDKGVKNVIYDPYNRDYLFNTEGVGLILESKADTVTCFNVLNVINDKLERFTVIHQAYMALKPMRIAYFTVYEGDKSGVGKETRCGWQENRKLETYVSEIEKVFPATEIRYGMIWGYKPLTSLKTYARI
jgi:hypothetical protein